MSFFVLFILNFSFFLGTFIWNKGDKADRAFIVESGSVKFDAPIPRSRRPSEMGSHSQSSQELAAALKEALSKPDHSSMKEEEQQKNKSLTPRRSRTNSTESSLKRSNTGRAGGLNPTLQRGAFIADTDSLLGGTEISVGVVAAEDSTLLMIDRKDLIIFFSNNPGVLLATVHSKYVH